MQHEKEIQAIKMGRRFLKKINGPLNKTEQKAVDQWLESSEENRKAYQDMLSAENIETEFNQLTQYNAAAALERVKEKHESKLPITPVWKIAAKWLAVTAAIFCIAFGIGLYWYNTNQQKIQSNPIAHFGGDATPGTNRATLILADGSTINLSDNQNGIVIGNKDIKYADGSTISPQVLPDRSGETQLTLNTPKGGQYQVTLPDGTKVWLNAASTLKYPRRFIGKQRRIELAGEAYFEVAHNKKQPFVVSSNGQKVTVLGTHFNINAYPDERSTKTTLLEGSVRVVMGEDPGLGRDDVVLKPNEQAINTGSTIKVQHIDVAETTAWKDNIFIFHNTSLKAIMRQISRWYDIEVDINSMPDIEFYAEIPRNVKLSQVLSMLEATGHVKFKVVTDNKERRIIIEK